MNRYMFQKIIVVSILSIYTQVAGQDVARLDEGSLSDHSNPVAQGFPDDLEDIELGTMQKLTADDLMPFVSRTRNITKKERRAHIEQVLERAQTRGGKGSAYLADLQAIVAQKKGVRSFGLPITVNEEHIQPALEWFGKKVLKEDIELLNTKFDRQKIITGFSTAGAFVVSSGIACLLAYLGSLY